MLKKETLRILRTNFWTAFEKYNQKQKSASGKRVNWTNYKSNIKDIYFRLDFTTTEAFLAIDLQMKDFDIRELVWEQFMETKNLLLNYVGTEMELMPNHLLNDGQNVHRICWRQSDVNIINASDYERTIEFLSKKIRGLDEFWCDFSDLFVALCK
jgi:hypothetical protein